MRLALHVGIVVAGVLLALPAHAQSGLSDAEIRRALIRQSIVAYPGPCACPYNIMRNGKPCNTASAYSTPGGRSPLCFERDVMEAKLGPKEKQAYAIRPAQGGFGFAGLWNVWRGRDGVPVESYTVITTDAAPTIEHIHCRMPRVLQGTEFDLWLGADAEAAAALLKPSQAEFEFWKVSPRVNNWRNDDAEILNSL